MPSRSRTVRTALDTLPKHLYTFNQSDSVTQTNTYEHTAVAHTNKQPHAINHKILFLISSNFLSTSPGVRSNSAATACCFAGVMAGNWLQRSPSTTSRTGKYELRNARWSRPASGGCSWRKCISRWRKKSLSCHRRQSDMWHVAYWFHGFNFNVGCQYYLWADQHASLMKYILLDLAYNNTCCFQTAAKTTGTATEKLPERLAQTSLPHVSFCFSTIM